MNSANRGLIGFSFVPGLQVVLLYVIPGSQVSNDDSPER